MADNQFDVSPKFVRLFEEKQKIREAIRQAVLKQKTNPHLAYGAPYDAAVSKYHSLWLYRNEHVYANPRNLTVMFAALILPVSFIYFDLVRHNNHKEKKLRSGEISYVDRCYKNVL